MGKYCFSSGSKKKTVLISRGSRRTTKVRGRFADPGGAARIELTSGSQRADAHAFYKACGYSDGTLRFIKRLGDA